jgi:hypothetical protein
MSNKIILVAHDGHVYWDPYKESSESNDIGFESVEDGLNCISIFAFGDPRSLEELKELGFDISRVYEIIRREDLESR